jgi:hypothetical protein
MNNPVWTGIFELDLGMGSSTMFAMVVLVPVGRVEEHLKK